MPTLHDVYEITGDVGDLQAPAMLAAFEGWVSAGSAGTGAADHAAGDGPEIARFDSDTLFDYRVNRPTAVFEEGRLDDVEWPAVTVRRRTIDARDLLVVTGPEPNWHWHAFAAAAADLATRLGTTTFVSLGGIPWATAHTRPTVVVTTASRPDLLTEDANPPEGTLRVPASVTLAISEAVARTGVPTVGLWARVPHYVASAYHPAIVELVERLSRYLGVNIPLGSLVDQAAAQRRQLDALVESRPEAKAMIDRMEQLADAEGNAVTGEDLAAEIERYLREAGNGEDPGLG